MQQTKTEETTLLNSVSSQNITNGNALQQNVVNSSQPGREIAGEHSTSAPQIVDSFESTDQQEQQEVKASKHTKYRICIVAAIWGFLIGLERAIVLPTLWKYFDNKFGKSTAFDYYGITLAAFNLSILVFDPIFGILAYAVFRVKILLLLSNQMGIIGNIIYFIGSHPWMLTLGRLIAGVGAACEVPLYADIVRSTSRTERTFYIVTLLLCRQFGLIIGPSCSLLMKNAKITVGNVKVDVLNGPGLLLSVLWVLHTILVIFVYPNMNAQSEDRESSNNENEAENSISNEKQSDEQLIICGVDLTNYRPYLTWTSLTLLAGLFGAYYSLMSLESVLPPVAARYFNWTIFQISWVYFGAGIAAILIYVFLRYLSQKNWQDRNLLLIGFSVLSFAYLWLTIILACVDRNNKNVFVVLILLGVAMHIFGMPFIVACAESLFTKKVPQSDQERAQSILRTIINVALLIGTFIAGELQFYPWSVFLLQMLLIVFPLIFFIKRFSEFA